MKESEADALSDPHWVEREKEIPQGGAIPTTLILRGEKFTASPAVCSATTEAVTVCIKRVGSEQMPRTEKKKRKKKTPTEARLNKCNRDIRAKPSKYLIYAAALYPWQQENKTTHQHNASSYHMEACLVFYTSFLPSHITNAVFFFLLRFFWVPQRWIALIKLWYTKMTPFVFHQPCGWPSPAHPTRC